MTRGEDVGGRGPWSAWLLTGVCGLFAWAVVRLGGLGIATVRDGLDAVEWATLVLLAIAFVYGEGVVALDRRWVPHLFERARRIEREDSLVLRLLAPLYGLSLIGASRAALMRAWAGTAGILLAVALVRALPPPWRGITDLAVAAALAWGLVAILRRLPREATGSCPEPPDPDVHGEDYDPRSGAMM